MPEFLVVRLHSAAAETIGAAAEWMVWMAAAHDAATCNRSARSRCRHSRRPQSIVLYRARIVLAEPVLPVRVARSSLRSCRLRSKNISRSTSTICTLPSAARVASRHPGRVVSHARMDAWLALLAMQVERRCHYPKQRRCRRHRMRSRS